MRHEGLFWLRIAAWTTAVVAMLLALFDAGDWLHWDVVAMVAGFVAVMISVGLRMANDLDGVWLPRIVVTAFFVKLLGAAARWYVLIDTYDGAGDAVAYHDRGLLYAGAWRSLEIPQFQVGSSGTTFASKAVALLYAPHEPSSMLGGFFLFAALAFVGQLLFYAAFRRAQPQGRLKLYAVAVLMLPSIVFWPSSIGKESLMLLFIGLIAYGLSRVFDDYGVRWVPVIVAGTAGAAGIRLHVAALLAAAGAAAMFLTKRPDTGTARLRRVAMLCFAGLAVILLITMTSETFGIDPDGTDLDPFLDEIQRRTQQGGSAVEGEAVRTVFAIPEAALRVLFRPLPTEATSIQAYLSAFENVIIMALIVWRLPGMLASARRLRANPYLMFSLFFVIGFVIVFSAIFNLGILARQRTQALPFLLAVIVGLGWAEEADSEITTAPALARSA